MIAWLNSPHRAAFAGALFLLGSLANLGFRCGSGSPFGPFVLVVGFSIGTHVDTADEYRVKNHGTVISIKREFYDANIFWGIAALVVQLACWIPAGFLFSRGRQFELFKHWKGVVLLLLAFPTWLLYVLLLHFP